MPREFEHTQFAHCESGVVSTLVSQKGLQLSEPMVFGLTASLSFVYLPVIKLNNMPLIAYRQLPKNIINKIAKVLNLTIVTKRYKNAFDAQRDLDGLLEEGKLVGLQTSVFYLPYFPPDMRFHFNAHNLIVYGKEGNRYKISDPVFEEGVTCDPKDLAIARFAKGVFAPKGFLYYIDEIDQTIDMAAALKKAIRKNAKVMLIPFPYGGVKGMFTLAKKIASLQSCGDRRYLTNFLTHIVRMQEEIGTGGGGFRFLYAAFLQEAIGYGLPQKPLQQASELMTRSGNTLREFALLCVQGAKNPDDFDAEAIAAKLREAAQTEREAFSLLKGL